MAGLRAPFTLTGIAALAAALYGALRLPETVGTRGRAAADKLPVAVRAARVEALQVTILMILFSCELRLGLVHVPYI
jgi:hypothetical protein